MGALRRRMVEDMQLRDLAARTQESYAAAVSLYARHFGRSPELISEEEARGYFVHLIGRRAFPRQITW